MKNKSIALILCILFSLISCEKDEFDVNNPDVDEFVGLLKNGAYKFHELPDFKLEQIDRLLYFANDTSEISTFPVNPISSKITYPKILGECLLWTIEGIRLETKYPSLEPHLIDTLTYTRLSGQELLEVSDIYRNWWQDYKKNPTNLVKRKNLLENTSYRWN